MRTYSYSEMLRLTDRLRGPAIGTLLHSLQLPPGSRGLDVGCGIGLYTPLLAELVGAAGNVVGVDINEEFLCEARAAASRTVFGDRIEYRRGDIASLPFADAAFDWLISIDTIWPGSPGQSPIGDNPVQAVRELRRVVRPGGVVALAYWSSHHLLPGHPQLEARLQATAGAVAPFADGLAPELHFMCAMNWLTAVGLRHPSATSATADIVGPLLSDTAEALAATFAMLWDRSRTEVSADDWATCHALCDTDSIAFIGNDPAYHGIITYTIYTGVV